MDNVSAARSPEDYQEILLAAYPPGDAFPRDAGSLRGKMALAKGDGLSRAEAAAMQILETELDPRTATFMFPDWVTMTGVNVQPTREATVAAIMARIQQLGGQSIAYFINLAARLSFTITIVKHRPARAGRARCGDPLGLADWSFVWDVVTPLINYQHGRAGQLRAGEPLATWGSSQLEQLIRRYQPAIGFVRFIYT